MNEQTEMCADVDQQDMTSEQRATADVDGNPTINSTVQPPKVRGPQKYNFMSNFGKIVDCTGEDKGTTPKAVLQFLARETKISYRLMKGFYTSKFTPSIKEACRIAQACGVNVEGIWYLLPVQDLNG